MRCTSASQAIFNASALAARDPSATAHAWSRTICATIGASLLRAHFAAGGAGGERAGNSSGDSAGDSAGAWDSFGQNASVPCLAGCGPFCLGACNGTNASVAVAGAPGLSAMDTSQQPYSIRFLPAPDPRPLQH